MERPAAAEQSPAKPGLALKPPAERILFALNPEERAQFFPDGTAPHFPRVRCSWLSPAAFAQPDAWTRSLQQTRPTILVSGWATPALPQPLLFSHDLPLRYVCHVGGSVRRTVPREFLVGGGLVTNWGNLIGPPVAEHALLLILASLRNLPQWRPGGPWGNGHLLSTRSLHGKRVGLHGYGRIARELVRLLQPFHVICSAFAEHMSKTALKADGVAQLSSLEHLFRENAIVVECEALTPSTAGSVTQRLLALMPDDAVFVNIARGAIVDETAMAEEAARGRIRVASDVFQHEPLPPHSLLWRIPGLIVSPHIGGPTSDGYARFGALALENLKRYLDGRPLEGRVTLDVYDRST